MSDFSKVHDLRRLNKGRIAPSTLMGLAEDTVAECAGMSAAHVTPMGSTAHYYLHRPTKTILARARIMERRGAAITWSVDLYDSARQPLAQFTLSYLAEQQPAVAWPDQGPPAEPQDHYREPLGDKLFTIAQAACGVISEKGFAAATMREIAAAAGMHVPTMYQYVRSKEEVLEQVYHMVIARVSSKVGPVFELDLPPDQKLLRVIECLVRNNGLMRKETGVLNREMRSLAPDARARVLANYERVTEHIGTIISDGIAAGQFLAVNAKLMANMIDALCDMWALRPFALTDVEEAEFLEEVRKLLTQGLYRD
jgi:AcrR family transcriptional regulator